MGKPRKTVLSITTSVLAVVVTVVARASDIDARNVIALERAALDRWGNGDPRGYLELYAKDITYFDVADRRVNGIDAMKEALEPIAGKIKILHYDMVDPKVQQKGGVAILTYRFVSEGSEGKKHWNNTEVYARTDGKWKIIHSHWSLTSQAAAAPQPAPAPTR